MKKYLDQSYGPDPQHQFDALLPDTGGPFIPWIVIHGSISADEDRMLPIGQKLVGAGYAAFLIDYRDWGSPAPPTNQLADFKLAISYIRKTFSPHRNIDWTRGWGLYGNSLGGYASGLLVTDGSPGYVPTCLVTASPLVDLTTMMDYPSRIIIGHMLEEAPLDDFENYSLPPRIAQRGAPPWFHTQCVDEWNCCVHLPYENGQRLDAALTTAGIEHVFKEMPAGSGHAENYLDKAWPDIEPWVKKFLVP